MEIKQRRYYNTKDFVEENELQDIANGLFGENWVCEDDVYQIESLLVQCGEEFYDVKFVEGLNSDYDIEVTHNENAEELYNLLIEEKKKNKYTQEDLEQHLFMLAEHYAMTSSKSEIDDFNNYINETYKN